MNRFQILICLVCCTGWSSQAGLAQDTSTLQEIEQREMPGCLQEGPAQFENLTDYYWARNRELRKRFRDARNAFESRPARPFHALTLVAGAAGVGKTFIKGEAFDKGYPTSAVCKFDIKELYADWLKTGKTCEKPDLASGDVVISRLVAAKNPRDRLIYDYLAEKQAAFVIVDSLDEIHPDDYASVLSQLEDYAFGESREFVHVVIFARTLAFVDYWQAEMDRPERKDVKLFELKAPVFRATGDLAVSSWNYHCWRYKLAWAPDGASVPMPLSAYREWMAQDFERVGKFSSVTCEENQNISPQVNATLVNWAKQHCRVNGLLGNLAGNGMVREIAEQFVLTHRDYDETEFQRAYFEACLKRDARTDNRPDSEHAQQLDLYLRLLEGVAAKYFSEQKFDKQGYFTVAPGDVVILSHNGRSLSFPVRQILDRSGLARIELPLGEEVRYRFEPIWLHRYLLHAHVARSAKRVTANSANSARD